MPEGISIVPMADTAVTPAAVAALFNEAFCEYEGVIRATPETMAWYLRRPGLGSEHVFLALAGQEVVGGVMVTATEMVFGGGPLLCGFVDSVMTRPMWRRRGIASGLMEHALAWMGQEGLAASALYTTFGSGGHRLYTRIGFRDRATCYYFYSQPAPRCPPIPGLRPAAPDEVGQVRALLNDRLGGCDGFVPVDEALWRWRREDRPGSLPYTLFVLEDAGRIAGTGTLLTARAEVPGDSVDLAVLTDVAGATPVLQERVLRGLLHRVPLGCAAGVLTGSPDRVLPALAERLGLGRHEEVAMVLPLTDAARTALRGRPRGWYTLAESLLGI